MEEQETSTLTVIGWPFLYKKSSFSYVHIQSQNWKALKREKIEKCSRAGS